MKLLELTSDTIFKAFMMSERTKHYKARLISLVTGLKEEELILASYTSNELAIQRNKQKTYRTDILVCIPNSIINLEMNSQRSKGRSDKNNLYIQVLASEQLERGDSYLSLRQVI